MRRAVLYRREREVSANAAGAAWEVRKFIPTLSKPFLKDEKKTVKNILVRFWFLLMAGKRLAIYYVQSEDGRLIHTSVVMPKCLKFQYLKKGECEIGPCYTNAEYRGRGIYPCVLKHILSDYGADMYYMTVGETNVSSIRGIEKAGFTRYGFIEKTKFFKFYRYAEEEDK